jgi:hypothetical protein
MTEVIIDKMPTGITHLYDMVAEKLGHDPSKCQYDCTKIEVAKNLADAIEECYNPHDGTNDWPLTFSMHWCCFGPKENDELLNSTVVVEDGFIQEV